VSLSCSHIEPDVTYLHTILDQHHTDRHDAAHQFRKRLEQFIYDPVTKQRKFVITSVDRLEGLSALPLKLRAFDRFLALHPSKHGSVVMIQIGITLDSRPNDYHQTRDYVQRFVTEINKRYSTGPSNGEQVVYFEEKAKATCAERMHLWRMSDAYLDTCVRFGLSLLPFEYLVAQKRNLEQASDRDAATHQFGTMIVSEFASYSRILNGCVLVNPWKTDDIVNALVKATEMQYYEKLNRFQINYKFLELNAHTRWADRLLADFEVLEQKKQLTVESRDTVEFGFGFDYRVMQFTSGFVKLDIDEVVAVSTRCSRRLFVFDYGGTLSWTTSILEEDSAAHHCQQYGDTGQRSREIHSLSSVAFGQEVIRYIDGQVRTPLSKEAHENIQTLCADPQNIVFVVSTGRRAELDAEFGSIPNLHLVADNGLFVKKSPRERETASHWECICDPRAMQMEWKTDVQRVMQSYTSRTNGAFLIEGEASLLYDYRSSDPEYGEIQALELYEQLRQTVKVC
jgi:trehalose 6-phosphate synthase/phosphatase